MSRAARKSMISCEHPELSVAAQCALLKVPRSTFYYQQEPMREAELALRRSIDVIYTRWPFYGSRRMVLELADEGYVVSRKRVRRLMQSMGLAVIYQKPNTSAAHPGHRIYPYLLRNIVINRPNQVWCADITYIPMARGFVYLVAVMDWFSRKVLAWRLSLTMDAGFCAEALQEAMDNHGKPEIFNTDQGAQFTSEAFTGMLAGQGIQISMDGKGRFLDNIFIERLWRSLKYEEVVCCERHRSYSERWRCFTGDEGRPLEVGLQERASNRHELQWSRAIVVNVAGKGGARLRQVRVKETNASEPLMTCRNVLNDVETGTWTSVPRTKVERNLFTAQPASGMKAA